MMADIDAGLTAACFLAAAAKRTCRLVALLIALQKAEYLYHVDSTVKLPVG